MNHLPHLTHERPIGSEANARAAEYIRQVFQFTGLETEEQAYPASAWSIRAAALEVDGAPVFVEPNVFSPACDVSAPMVPLCTIRELENADLSGKIALFYGDLASRPLSPKSWFLKDERDDHIINLLETKQPAALLAPPATTVEYEQVTEDWELDIPAATISPGTARFILTHGLVSAHLKLDCTREVVTVCNVVARTPMPADGRKVVICAHFDTKINTPGATDNGGAVACLLALAERLAGASQPFGLEFVAFNGEEYLPMGDDEYLRCGESAFGQIIAAINMDGVGYVLGTNSITTMSAPEEMAEKLKSITLDFPAVTWVESWPESNHSTFAFRGVPSVALGSVGGRHIAHTREDGIEMLSGEKLGEVVALVEVIVKNLA